MHPDLAGLLVTAVAPFLNSAPPLVLPGDCCVRLQCETGGMAEAEICLTVDGQEGHNLRSGDVITVCGQPGGLDILARHPGSYLQTLRQRGFIREFSTTAPERDPAQTAGPVSPFREEKA